MSTISNLALPSRDRKSVDQRLARLLDAPFFARVVPHLAPETLHQLIRYRGLEACDELVTAATPAQLTSLLDLDLWRHAAAGRDEEFDVDRFGEWIEVLVEAGESLAARTVAALDPHMVVTGLSRYLRLFDPGIFEPTESSDDEAADRDEMMRSETRGDVLECEVGGYLVRARRFDAWDAIVALLVALETEHHDYFHAVMQGCRRLSNSTPEVDGLDALLGVPEQHLHDVALERQRRRSWRGYATPADARAFLKMARQARAVPAPGAHNPIAAAYFREAEEVSEQAAAPGPVDAGIPASIEAITALLAEAGVIPERPRTLLEAADKGVRSTKLGLLTRLMGFVRDHDDAVYLTRSRELAFLANTLLAGGSVQSRPFTAREASDAAACVCNLGLDCWPARWPETASQGSSPPRLLDTFLVDHDLVSAFEVGWSVLHEDVSLFVADQLERALSGLHDVDAGTRREIRALRRALAQQREAGTPWLARDAADVLAVLDTTAWVSVLGLLDECPILPAALTAVLERRSTGVSPTAFEFISGRAQIDDVRLFMRVLPGVLSR